MGSVDDRFQSLLGEAKRLREEQRGDLPPLPPGGGGGTSGGDMELRVKVLEERVDVIRRDLAKLEQLPVQMATLTERVAHLPSKGFVVGAALSTVGGVTAAIALLQKIGLLH